MQWIQLHHDGDALAATARMVTIRHILCPVDLSDGSLRALAHASSLGAWYESSVQALYVEEAPLAEDRSDYRPLAVSTPALVDAGAMSRTLEDVRAFAARVAASEAVEAVVEWSTQVEEAILERARTWPADLIVMGSQGRSGIQRMVLGSVAEHVLRAASCPVMVVPPRDAVAPSVVSFKHIVCAIDFSDSSLAALTWALSLAEEADARLSLLHVIEVPPELRVSTVVTDREIDELHAAMDADIRARLRSLIPVHASDFCSPETATAAGAAGHAILAFASERVADLIVMGAGRHTSIERLLFGSKTRDVVAGATCPVLTVRR
jgi:nucleotide-binding universal stress UspA family protein